MLWVDLLRILVHFVIGGPFQIFFKWLAAAAAAKSLHGAKLDLSTVQMSPRGTPSLFNV